MTHDGLIRRINRVLEISELASGFQVQFHRGKKLLLGGSFDLTYCFQVFLLFTGVEKRQTWEPGDYLGTIRSLESREESGGGKITTTLKNFWPEEPAVVHRKLYYYAPSRKVLRNGLDLTAIVDECLRFTDELPP